jgi:ribonuclease HI
VDRPLLVRQTHHERSLRLATSLTMTLANSELSDIYTYGACKGNRGRGGWAAVFFLDGERRIVSGDDRSTTSNRMELTAAIRGLLATKEHQNVIIHSDSQYLINTMTRGWERNTNLDLWAQLDQIRQTRNIAWKWVSSNQSSPGNEIANRVASMEAGLFQTRDDSSPRRRTMSAHGKAKHRRHTGSKPSGNTAHHPKRSKS